MRRIVVERREFADFIGTRCTSQRSGLACRLARLCADEPLISACAGSFRNSGESKDCSPALTSTAENSEAPQGLFGATNRSLPPAPILGISWHCPCPAPGGQIFAAQSGAHAGAIAKARTVSMASMATFAGRARTGIVWFILSSLRLAVASSCQLSARWRAKLKNNSRHQRGASLRSPKSERRTPFGNFENRPSPAAAATEDAAQSKR
jgi:hypothetical protein